MPFEQKGTKALSERVTLRLALDEKQKLMQDAELAGISVSEVIRRHYFGKPIIASANVSMIRELRRMGALMKNAHLESKGAYSTQTSDAITSIARCIDTLASGK
jgi:hypothetical protein